MAYVPSIRTKSVTYGIYDRVCVAEMNRIDGPSLRQKCLEARMDAGSLENQGSYPLNNPLITGAEIPIDGGQRVWAGTEVSSRARRLR